MQLWWCGEESASRNAKCDVGPRCDVEPSGTEWSDVRSLKSSIFATEPSGTISTCVGLLFMFVILKSVQVQQHSFDLIVFQQYGRSQPLESPVLFSIPASDLLIEPLLKK